MTKKFKLLIWLFSGILILFIVNLANGWHIAFSSCDPVTAEYGNTPPAPAAMLCGNLFFKNGFSLAVKEKDSTSPVLGKNIVRYEAGFLFLNKTIEREIIYVDTTPPHITLTHNPDNYTIPGEPYQEEGFLAIDACDGDITSRVIRTEASGIVTYSVSDSSGNTATVTRDIHYHDPIAPVITLAGSDNVVLDYGTEYIEDGFTATDNCDGDITSRVNVISYDDRIEYSVADSYENVTTITRKLTYQDLSAPEITLNGSDEVTVYLGDEYTEEGCVAIDKKDGDVTSSVEIVTNLDITTPGVYTITYSVRDLAGNSSEATRIVQVKEFNIPALEEKGKVVYLTFDDGPCAYTYDLLDVLDKYNVKATFFVTKNNKNADVILKEIASRGHSIGIHTMSHNYSQIYSSVDAFMEDLYGMQDYIYEITGNRTYLSRFPGGSSNMVSANYCKGIMTELTKKVREEGFQYFDWNVSSEDASGKKGMTSSEVTDNVIRGIRNRKVSVVLQHDIKKFSVDGVEEILKWGQENGFVFLPLTMDSFPAHHGINN